MVGLIASVSDSVLSRVWRPTTARRDFKRALTRSYSAYAARLRIRESIRPPPESTTFAC
jgi:hypothetical protein